MVKSRSNSDVLNSLPNKKFFRLVQTETISRQQIKFG